MFGFGKKKKEPFYKFDIGQVVNIHSGWEKPLGFGTIENRSYGYRKNYAGIMVAYPIYKIADSEYENRDLRIKK